MNNQRRKQIERVIVELNKIQAQVDAKAVDESTGEADPNIEKNIVGWQKTIESICDDVSNIKDDEDEYRDNMPESLQESDKFYTSEEASDALERAHSMLECLYECEPSSFIEVFYEDLETITDKLNDATA